MKKNISSHVGFALAMILGIIARSASAVTPSPVVLNSWYLSGQSEYSEVISGLNGGTTSGPSTTWSGQTSIVLGDVQKVQYSTNGIYVYVSVPDLSGYVMGAWWNNAAKTVPFINFPKNQSSIYRVALATTYPSTSHGTVGDGTVAILVNGVSIFNSGDAFSYQHSSSSDVNPGDGIWNRLAEAVEATTFDHALAHQPGSGQYHNHVNPTALRAQLNDNIDYVGTTNYFPYNPSVYYLTHGEGADGTYAEQTTNLHHSPIIGWMFDGYPIYGPYGYTNPTDSTSAVTRMTSSYSLRTDLTTGSPRISIPGWSAALDTTKLASSGTLPGALYTMTSTEQASYAGPAVSSTYPLGRYGEDYAYVSGSGTLDQFNGRYCVTPDFPNGTYAYFVTIDSTGAAAFPYIVNRQYYGPLNGSGSVTSITETVTTSFNIATNTAPVVTGPSTASVAHLGTFSFTSANLITLSDIDAAPTESITLTVSSGTLTVNLSGILAGLTTITGGANGSSTMTLSGAISEINAALATLTYAAPVTGTSASLTVQANDGSSSNNLSNILTTTITLTPSSNANLSGLVPSTGTLSPTFSSATLSYTESVPYTTTSMTLTPTVAEVAAAASVNGNGVASGSASGAINLAVGSNTITIIVLAEDGVTTQTYTLAVARAALSLTYTSSSTVPVTSDGFTASGALSLTLDFAPTVGSTVLTVVNNTGTGPIAGTFTGLPQGSTLSASYGGTAYYFTISYVGGDGNDITLTSVQPVPAGIQVKGSMGFRRATTSPRQ